MRLETPAEVRLQVARWEGVPPLYVLKALGLREKIADFVPDADLPPRPPADVCAMVFRELRKMDEEGILPPEAMAPYYFHQSPTD